MRRLMALGFVVWLAPLTVCMASAPATRAATQPATMTLVRIEPLTNEAGAAYHIIHLRLTNQSDRPLHFNGYGSSPFVSRMELRDGKWRGPDLHDWCGTGLQKTTIAAGQSIEFSKGAPPPDVLTFRLGTQVRESADGPGLYVWSEPISIQKERRE